MEPSERIKELVAEATIKERIDEARMDEISGWGKNDIKTLDNLQGSSTKIMKIISTMEKQRMKFSPRIKKAHEKAQGKAFDRLVDASWKLDKILINYSQW